MSRLSFLVCAFISISLSAQSVILNEVVAKNESLLIDADGDDPDWVELYNPSNVDMNLAGYALQDETYTMPPWIFPSVMIPAQGYLLVFLSTKDRYDPAELHTDFALSSSGESLRLLDNAGNVIDSIPPVRMTVDQVYRRLPNASSDWYLSFSPSPNASNDAFDELVFSHEAGFYSSPFDLNIVSVLGDSVRCTQNGSVPTASDALANGLISIGWSDELLPHWSNFPTSAAQNMIEYPAWEFPEEAIEMAQVMRCATFNNGLASSETFTRSFIVDSSIFDRYDLPIISISVEGQSLFHQDSGLYVPGNSFDVANPAWTGNFFQHGEASQKPAHIEYFEADGTMGFSQNCGLRLHGSKSRQGAQKSLRLYASKDYGRKGFYYRLFPQKRLAKYERFVLGTSMSPWRAGSVIDDPVGHEIMRALNIEMQDYRPVVVFLNGEYWGIHTIRDRIDKRYIAYMSGVEGDSVQIVEGIDPDILDYVEQNDLSVSANYAHIGSLIDIANFIDYQIAEMFLGNNDWPANNLRMWRAGGKWRWIFYDVDGGFTAADYNMFEHCTLNDPGVQWPNSASSTALFRNLVENEEFVDRFALRYAELLRTAFDRKNTLAIVERIKDLYRHEMEAHANRWGFPEDVAEWNYSIENGVNEFLKNRACNVEQNLVGFFRIKDFEYACLDNEAQADIILGPNPNDGRFFLHNNSGKGIIANLEVYTSSGRLIFSERSLSLNADQRVYRTVGAVSDGLYLVRLKGQGVNFQSRIIVRR